jgi:hypothetical protein
MTAMKNSIITTAAVVALTLCMTVAARGTDFWEAYGMKLMYNYSVKTGSIPGNNENTHRLSEKEIGAVMTKTFSQTLGDRVKDVSRRQGVCALVCIFTPEPDRCVADGILRTAFEDVRIMKAPSFSNKFLKKVRRYYAYTLNGDENQLDRRKKAARNVPSHKKFNPRFGIDLEAPQFIASMPFYSYLGMYIEPKYGTARGFSATFIKDRFFVDADREGVAVKYHVRRRENARGFTSITFRPEGEIAISNEFILK